MYTKENVICFYDDEKVAGLIGKEVYYSLTPYGAVTHANEDVMCSTLVSASYEGFVVKGSDMHWSFIIGKKFGYSPFNSFEEFALSYDSVFNGLDSVGKCIYRGGFWLIDKYTNDRLLVKGYADDGIVLNCDVLGWDYVLEHFLMPDKTPCGVKEE